MRASVLVGMGAMWLTSGEDLGGSDHKESTCNAGAVGLIPRLGRSHRGGTGNPLWYTCLENSTDRRVWRGQWGRKESDVTECLILSSFHHHHFTQGKQNLTGKV